MLIPAFTLELNNTILHKLVAVGKFDGKHPSLTCGTSAGKIFFHSPHEKDPQAQIKFLNINRRISALACGRLDPKMNREVLLVGAQTTLLCYDINENMDVFFKDVPDGVNTIVVGSMDKAFGGGGNMALVGGNCSIQGFDHQGEEAGRRDSNARRRRRHGHTWLICAGWREPTGRSGSPRPRRPIARRSRPSGPSRATTSRR